MSIIPTAEDEAITNAAKRADDPFRGPRFGPVGQYRNCDLCGGKFESRGLKLCPDCYEIRKTQPDFDDDRRWSSAAGRAVLKRLACLLCGGPIPAFTETGHKTREGTQFCCRVHRQRWGRMSEAERVDRAGTLARMADV